MQLPLHAVNMLLQSFSIQLRNVHTFGATQLLSKTPLLAAAKSVNHICYATSGISRKTECSYVMRLLTNNRLLFQLLILTSNSNVGAQVFSAK